MSEQAAFRVGVADATAPAVQREYRSGVHAKRQDSDAGWGFVLVGLDSPARIVSLMDGAVVGSAARDARIEGAGVAPEHARISVRSDGCYIEDMDTPEGTWVNGVRARRIGVMHGDVVRLGRQLAVFVERHLAHYDGVPSRLGGLVLGQKQRRDWIDPVMRLVESGSSVCIEGAPGLGKRTLARLAAAVREGVGETQIVDGSEEKPIIPTGVRPATWVVLAADRVPRPLQIEIAHSAGRQSGVIVIATTDQPLDRAAGDGRVASWFASLFSGKRVTVPALEMRREDLLLIARDIADRHGIRPDRFTPELLEALLRAGWPGGVPELEGAIVAAAQAPDGPLSMEAIAGSLSRGPRLKPNLPPATDPALARARLEDALARANGSVASAARSLGMSRQAIYREADRLGLDIARRKIPRS